MVSLRVARCAPLPPNLVYPHGINHIFLLTSDLTLNLVSLMQKASSAAPPQLPPLLPFPSQSRSSPSDASRWSSPIVASGIRRTTSTVVGIPASPGCTASRPWGGGGVTDLEPILASDCLFPCLLTPTLRAILEQAALLGKRTPAELAEAGSPMGDKAGKQRHVLCVLCSVVSVLYSYNFYIVRRRFVRCNAS